MVPSVLLLVTLARLPVSSSLESESEGGNILFFVEEEGRVRIWEECGSLRYLWRKR